MSQTLSASVGNAGRNLPADGKIVQALLNAHINELRPLHALSVDGIVGPKTIQAIIEFQRRVVKIGHPDGRVDPSGQTFHALNGAARVSLPPPNLTARFDSTSKVGELQQITSGKITVNYRTYDFRSGGFGRGFLPAGSYFVTPHRWDRSEAGFSVGGIGYSFALSDTYDARIARYTYPLANSSGRGQSGHKRLYWDRR